MARTSAGREDARVRARLAQVFKRGPCCCGAAKGRPIRLPATLWSDQYEVSSPGGGEQSSEDPEEAIGGLEMRARTRAERDLGLAV